MNEASYDRVNIMKAIQVVILTPRDMNVKASKQTDASNEGGNEGEEQED